MIAQADPDCCRSKAPAVAIRDREHARPSAVDLPRAERAVRELLLAVGEDPDRDGLRDTPQRVARAYGELLAGLREDPATHLARTFEQEEGEIIVVRDIEFFSLCEHHLLPFTGRAHVAYLPGSGRVVGLSKLARTVDVFARRPQLQERLTNQVADAIMDHLHARGAAVRIEAEHMCMKTRGVSKSGSSMVTVARRGDFKTQPALRSEVMTLLQSAR
jgi:GTP cyclohydrolase I